MNILNKQKTIIIDYDRISDKAIGKFINRSNNEFIIVYTSDLNENKMEIADSVSGVPVPLLIVTSKVEFKEFVKDINKNKEESNDVMTVSEFFYDKNSCCVKSLSEIGFLKLNGVYKFDKNLVYHIMNNYKTASVLLNKELDNTLEYLDFDTNSNGVTLRNIVLNSDEMINHIADNNNLYNFIIGDYSGRVRKSDEQINLDFGKDVYKYFESRIKYIIDYIMSI